VKLARILFDTGVNFPGPAIGGVARTDTLAYSVWVKYSPEIHRGRKCEYDLVIEGNFVTIRTPGADWATYVPMARVKQFEPLAPEVYKHWEAEELRLQIEAEERKAAREAALAAAPPPPPPRMARR
jgi:hypothetical protein